MRDLSINDIERDCDVSTWDVKITGKAKKQKRELPEHIANVLLAFTKALQLHGPIQQRRPNYGKIKGLKKSLDVHHCHLNKGRPTFVVVWKVVDKNNRKIEIIHVGTHEKTDYGQFD